jgi:hypothetical protein
MPAVDVQSHKDKKNDRQFVRVMAWIGASAIVLGLLVGIIYPGRVTGAIFPLGLIIFSLAGAIARRQDKISG